MVKKLQLVPTVLRVRPVAGALLKAFAPKFRVYGRAHWPGCGTVGWRVGAFEGLGVGPVGAIVGAGVGMFEQPGSWNEAILVRHEA